jgi:hypothetical protein
MADHLVSHSLAGTVAAISERKQRQEKILLWALLIIGLLFIACGVRGTETWAHFADAFVTEAGIALVIGSLLANTIERYTRHRAETEHSQMRLEIEEDVFRHLFGFGLHKSIIDELTETIFASKLMRDGLHLQYEFESVPGREDLGVRLTVSYDIVNTSRSKESVLIRHYFENILLADGDPDCFTALLIEGAGGTTRLARAQLAGLVKKVGIRRVLTGPRVDVSQDRPIHVSYSCEFITRRADLQVWITSLPATSLRLTVALVDRGLDDLAFATEASHREEPELLTRAPQEGTRVFEWSIGSGVLPYQGIVLYWCPKDRMTAATGDLDGGAYVLRGPDAQALGHPTAAA